VTEAKAHRLVQSGHPGLDPGSMNTAVDQPGTAAFMDSGFRRNDGGGLSNAAATAI
jgi:hypothetical protein